MAPVTVKGVPADICPRCGGFFLDHGEVERLTDGVLHGPTPEGPLPAVVAPATRHALSIAPSPSDSGSASDPPRRRCGALCALALVFGPAILFAWFVNTSTFDAWLADVRSAPIITLKLQRGASMQVPVHFLGGPLLPDTDSPVFVTAESGCTWRGRDTLCRQAERGFEARLAGAPSRPGVRFWITDERMHGTRGAATLHLSADTRAPLGVYRIYLEGAYGGYFSSMTGSSFGGPAALPDPAGTDEGYEIEAVDVTVIP